MILHSIGVIKLHELHVLIRSCFDYQILDIIVNNFGSYSCLQTIENAFSILDDGSGRGQMDALEFQTLLTTVGVERLTHDEVSTIMRRIPVDGNGMMDLNGAAKLFTFNDGLE